MKDAKELSEKEITRRMEAGLKKALSTPPKPFTPKVNAKKAKE